ncbi:hypothetical protein V2J09_007119 [Rumex salicifolius]
MSNRPPNYRHEFGRGSSKSQKKFVPRTPNYAPKQPNSNPTLSTSLRQSIPNQSDPPEAIDSAVVSGSRVRLADNGDWVSNRDQGSGNFVNYLPQDEAVAAGLGAEDGGLDPLESQRVVDLLNRELSRLLKLNPREFWKEVAKDSSLYDFLNSYLQYRSRWYDFPYHGAKEIVAGVIVGELELSRRVFMVLYRISSHRDPGARSADSLSSRDHEVLLQDKGLLDLPKLLDICAIYGHENEDLARILVMNAIKAQPGIHNNFSIMISHFLGVVRTMHERCSSSLEAVVSTGGCEAHMAKQRRVEYLEVMDFVNDAIMSMDAFLTAYKPAAVFLCSPVEIGQENEELINFLARMHDSLLPLLQQGLQIIVAATENDSHTTSSSMLSVVSKCVKILSKRLVDFGWKLIDACYLTDEVFNDNLPPACLKMFPATVEDPIIRADVLVQTFKEIAGAPQYNPGNHYRGTYLHYMEGFYQVMDKIDILRSTGWISIDDEQYQYLSGIMRHPMMSVSKELPSVQTSRKDDFQVDEDTIMMESKISQIRDLFPDYGKGFLSACLDVYNHNPEEVIQRILEGTLHEDLQRLDPSMEVAPPKKKASEIRNDKGKGKLIEPITPLPRSEVLPSQSSSSSSASYSAAPVGRFVRKAKADQPDSDTLNSKSEKHMEKTAALSSQYEYEDEYDDSFDDLGMTVESGSEVSETLRDRMSKNAGSTSSTRDKESNAPSASSKWGSKKKPQFYVKDGKNYSYKVEGAVAASNYNEASLVNEAQKEMIHGLGQGGNLPLGAVRKLEEANNNGEEDEQQDGSVTGEGGNRGRGRGRGRRGGALNHHRKDRAMRKQMSGFTGF